MECNRDEAQRAKTLAEAKMMKNDFEGARKIALKAKQLFPELDNISQLIAVCDIHCSAQKKINGSEKDLYGILQVENVADEGSIRKQYRKLALVLHPDKNKFPGAEAAFKLIGEANMTLSDKGKRSVYDIKCRVSARPSVAKIHNRQGNQNSYAQNKQNGMNHNHIHNHNHHQQSTSNRSVPLSFWTFCPFCSVKYEYYREFVNRTLRCQQCSKLFIAYDIGAQGTGAGPGPNRGQDQKKEVGKQEKVKVNIQKDGNVSSNFPRQTSSTGVQFTQGTKTEDTKPKVNVQKPMETETVKETNKKRGRKMVVESSDSSSDEEEIPGGVGGGSVGDRRRSSRQKQQVSYQEDGGDEFSPQKRSKLKKSSGEVEGIKEEDKSCNTVDVDNEHADMEKEERSKAKSDSDPVLFDCPDLEFSNFDKDKEEHCFAADQIWACYDSCDGMPRFYAHIRKVYLSEFRLRFNWLEADPDNDPEIKWAEEELPMACGKFVRGDTEETKDRLMFSHQIAFEKGVGRFSYNIFPQRGEIWALFKDWDIKWSMDPENHRKYKFDIVEILSVHDDGVSVAFLLKVKGFVSVFQRTIWAGRAEHRIPLNERFRFSHRIPSTKLTGTERAGVPTGSFELDTAALPDDLEEYYYYAQSHDEKVKPDAGLTNTPKKQMNSKTSNGLDKEMLNLRRSPRGLKGGDKDEVNDVDDKVNGVKVKVNDAIPSKISSHSSARKKLEQISHDFNSDKQIWKFKVGQIWAYWERNNNNNNRIHQGYAQIKQIESETLLHVSLLKLYNIRSNKTIQHHSCGLFKVAVGKAKTLPLESFSHIVKAEARGKNIFSIYPMEQQIWALYNTNADVADGKCEIVEVLESDESSIKVVSLTHVPGCNSVFRAPRMQRSTGKIVVIPQTELQRFFYQIPAFLFTEEKDGCLRGCWELDPEALRGLPLVGPCQG